MMRELEENFNTCKEFRIFTSELSTQVINLYKSLGYVCFAKKSVGTYNMVYMKKQR